MILVPGAATGAPVAVVSPFTTERVVVSAFAFVFFARFALGDASNRVSPTDAFDPIASFSSDDFAGDGRSLVVSATRVVPRDGLKNPASVRCVGDMTRRDARRARGDE